MIEIGENRLYHGDSQVVLKQFPDNSIDTVITDSPYALQFMGKDWDRVLPPIEIWIECLRVAKPGAILLAFGGTRTYHRLTCSIEDAGWIIRDCLMWTYGEGLPKSHNISAAIDKAAGAKREVVGTVKRWGENASGGRGGQRGNQYQPTEKGAVKHDPVTVPATEAAKLWDGWGTGLKPAWEPILIAMKPLDGTYAANALKHGVAGLNIDASRIGPRDRNNYGLKGVQRSQGNTYGNTEGTIADFDSSKGRWPANLIHDGSEGVVELFPESKSCNSPSNAKPESKYRPGQGNYQPQGPIYPGDSGSAARFFYCAKASKQERGEGNDHPTVKPLALMEYLCLLTKTPTGGTVLDPFGGSGTTPMACSRTDRRCIMIEKSEHDYNIAVSRVRDVVKRIEDMPPPPVPILSQSQTEIFPSMEG